MKSTHLKIGFATPFILLVCLAASQFIFQVRNLHNGTEYIVTTLTNDDTYYYLQTAWNTVRLGFVTFDGLHKTNGVQSLWFVIVVILSMVTHTKTGLLSAALMLCFLLNVSCYLVIWKLCALVKRPIFSLFMVGLWSLLSFSSGAFSSGMENSLHALLFWCAVWQVAVFLVRLHRGGKPNLRIVTILLIANCWARLDSAPFSVLLFLYCTVMMATKAHGVRLFQGREVRLLCCSFLLAIAGFAAQLISFFMMGGSFLPVSALIKISNTQTEAKAYMTKTLWEGLLLSFPKIMPSSLCPPTALFVLGFIGLLIILSRARSRLANSQPIELSIFANLSFVLCLGVFLYHLIISSCGVSYPPYFIWYRSPSFISWIIVLSLAGHICGESLAAKRGVRWLVPCFAIMIFTSSFAWFFIRINVAAQENNMHSIRYRAAIWIDKNLSPDAVLASWNAGELGYFSNRSVINLDGLVNSIEYYRRVLKGQLQMRDYLYENDVTYIIDYIENELTSRMPVLHTFACAPAPELRLKIWQVPQTRPKERKGLRG